MGFASVCDMWATSQKHLLQTAAWKEIKFLKTVFFPDKGRTKTTGGMDLIIDHRSSNEDQISCISLNRYKCSWHKLH